MKKALLISSYYEQNSNERISLVYKYLKNKYNLKLIVSNFSHARKKYFNSYNFPDDIILVPTLSYKKNISFSRILSHYNFAKDAAKIIEKEQADLVYICLPPNIVGYFCSKYAKKYKSFVILDILDVWPETFPLESSILKKLFINTVGMMWKNLREIAIKKADYVITESLLYSDLLNIDKKKSSTIWLASNINDTLEMVEKNLFKSEFIIGYLGGINKIVNFESLLKMAFNINKEKEVKIEIIGDGEEREHLICKLKEMNLQYSFFGIIYDKEKKKNIMERWSFGYNGQKESVVTALSYKSIEYFYFGIPLINSVKADTWNLVEERKCGFNFQHDHLDEIINKLRKVNIEEIENMKRKTKEVYQEYFTYDRFVENMDSLQIWK